MTPIVDCHSHTYLSGHGEGTVEELVAAAERKGIAVLAVTEHAPLPETVDPEHGFSMRRDQLEGYIAAIEAAAGAHLGIELVTGLEIDWRTGCEDFVTPFAQRVTYSLGSVHMLSDDWCFDDPAQIDGWKARGVDDVWREYFELWMDACGSSVPFTTMAHPDLPKKFGFMPSASFDRESRYREAAALAAEKGRMVEVNTAGWRKEVGEQYPSVAFLRAFRDAGVECTVGADAHCPADAGALVERAYEVMRQAGYTEVAVPTPDGDRRHLAL